MPESGEDQRMEMFFKNVVKSFGELQATKALQQQAEMVASTIGGHVREVLGPVQEGVDVIKNTFQNTWSFVKGTMDDLGNFFGLDEKIEEKAYRGTSLQQGAEIIEESRRSNEMFVQGEEAEWDRFEAQMDAFARMYQIDQQIVDEVKEGFKGLYDQVGKSSEIAKEELEKKKEERLKEMRETKKKDRTFWDRFIDLVMVVVFGPFAIIGGLIAGFVGMFVKVLTAPLRLLGGLARMLGFLPKASKVEGSVKGFAKFFKWFEELPVLGKIFGLFARNRYLGKLFRLGKFLGSKVLFPLFVFFDAISGLAKYKKIFGRGAGIREAIESAVAGIISGLTHLPAKILEWIVKKTTGIDIDIAKYFTIESWAKGLHKITDWFNDKIVKPVKDYVEDPETEKRWTELEEATSGAQKAFNKMLAGWRDKLKSFAEKYLMDDEETRKAWKDFENKAPEIQEQMVQEAIPGEAGMAWRATRLTPEELEANRERFEKSYIGRWIKENLDVGKRIDSTMESLTETMKTLQALFSGEATAAQKVGAAQTITNMALSSSFPSRGVAMAGDVWKEPKEELANPGVLLHNKGGP